MIKQEFFDSVRNYTSDPQHQMMMWLEIERNYSKSSRYYHNLTHLNSLVSELKAFKEKFKNWDTIIFSIAYHDIVYNTLKKNNEEKSADLAVKRLTNISFPPKEIAICRQLIHATKKHEPGDLETNLFTDADLSILGSDSNTYKEYSKQIRREYSIYPDIVYNPGREKALMHFLSMGSIFKTEEFISKYESNARVNIQTELNAIRNTMG